MIVNYKLRRNRSWRIQYPQRPVKVIKTSASTDRSPSRESALPEYEAGTLVQTRQSTIHGKKEEVLFCVVKHTAVGLGPVPPTS
jgi:hypothetical protein